MKGHSESIADNVAPPKGKKIHK